MKPELWTTKHPWKIAGAEKVEVYWWCDQNLHQAVEHTTLDARSICQNAVATESHERCHWALR